MKVGKYEEHGKEIALLGLSLSYNSDVERMAKRASLLCGLDGGHNKFLESIVVWLDIDAPRYWWSEFDTYRVGTTKQSESTMHTITARRLEQWDFECPIPGATLDAINERIRKEDWYGVKQLLPESFLQRRIVCTNYKTLRNIYLQRKDHKLPEWQHFCRKLLSLLDNPEYLTGGTHEVQ